MEYDKNKYSYDSVGPTMWDFERRMSKLEQRTALVEQTSHSIKDELTKVNNNLTKLVFIVISAVILAGLNVIFNGSGGI